ncbi:MAG TPA: S1C family serine protease [Bryobacteraceae bacterium]|jgi:S1-C subfamily serine protease|nr:S1C family serine protease [Bryobacteraceae bacterium]
MEQILAGYSQTIADLVGQAGRWAVAVEARHRMGSSGILWKPDVIVTADHAIRRDQEIPVTLPDGNRVTADVAGRDPGTDLAVLRLKTPAVASGELATSSVLPRTGEIVIAVGRHQPGLLALTGIVSTAGGPWKTWRGGHIDSLLRLDVAAYARSSGSAVIDSAGNFIGMLTGGLTRTAPLAIPVATIERVASELIAHGRIARGYLGVGLQQIPLPEAFAKALNREQRTAVIVLSVEPGGPADTAGIVLGDVIAGIAGHPVTDLDDVQSALRGSIGRELSVMVVRGGVASELRATIAERRQ